MCGICGGVLFGGGSYVNKVLIQKMTERLKHRGPDACGIYCKGPASLGHRRLSIIDLSPLATQPMPNEDSTVYIAINGEIYNHKLLRKRLQKQGHLFRSKSDSEVALHLYEEMGLDFIKELFGMFGLSIWDERHMRLILARDRIGQKPLFYSVTDKGIYFASEIKALLICPGIDKDINIEALHHYLTFEYVPSPLTIYKGINKLPPAHYLIWEQGKLSINNYWDLDYTKKCTNRSLDDLMEEFLVLFKDAVRLRLMSDVPLGAFLSGGIDSSATVAVMSSISDSPVKTFSIGFEDNAYNELPYAREVANLFNTEHQEFIVKPNAIEILPKLIWHYDEPFADPSAVPTYYLAKMTRQEVTVALSGDGGDESFAGYERYLADWLASIYTKIPNLAGPRFINWIARVFPCDYRHRGFIRRLKRFLNTVNEIPERRYCRWICFFDNETKSQLYSYDFAAKVKGLDSYNYIEGWFNKAVADNFLDRTLYVDIHTYLPDDLLVKVDIATMAHALEARSPFLDHRVIEFAALLPPNLKLKGVTKKYFLKKLFKKLLPETILNRKKMGFGIPLDIWFREDLREMAYDILLSRRAIERGYFLPVTIQYLLDTHCTKKADNSYRIWALLILELWHLQFADIQNNSLCHS